MRRLIVCVDGAWEDSTDRVGVDSNILHLLRSIESVDKRTRPATMQYAHHTTAHFSNSLVSQILGVAYQGFANLLFELYSFISMNYSEGDEIFIFGFSKGAYMARILAAILNDVGVLPRDDVRQFFVILKAYIDRKNGGTRVDEANNVLKPWLLSSPDNTRHKDQQFIVKCLGLFDCTVQSSYKLPIIGSRVSSIINKPEYCFGLPDALLGHRIEHCYHALALNENRSNLRDLRLELSNTGREKGQKCKQVWFTGSSGDIGGSYSVRELADLTRIWMAGQLDPIISLNKEMLKEQFAMPVFRWGLQPPHNPYTSKLTALMPVKRTPKFVTGGTEKLHPSVLSGSFDLAEPLIAAIERNTDLIEELSALEDEVMREWTLSNNHDADHLEITYAIDHKHFDEEQDETRFQKFLYQLQLIFVYIILIFLRKIELLFGFYHIK
ncbi:hypothetical protein WALSEDRAFT_60835 [Wallemia mellicola CBS 633.66]|uniref:T6SS Phospholipase effector Tle1-like catalytic domain-containing protein n=1 Tax=Wallemia mellicola (strain ATCC MYA-4683 / CBS 633.66) TaxID=671144 RepID=I4Y9X2_WALMC|nr:hypothetical protein WALSEDRAFT_60835 [Wallemia mellicola CBS 633.66]EIM20764.1 hypothetical protein WALSEDRAFT_60835 [Wallemia mellicola CBS 633.66]|eukprot:XP_006959290.1 hypothetical protein WALSEDRAFT_60835 [Wallemia mellicola CBS 633.66]